MHTVNSLNKTVFLQDKSDGENVFEQGSLALKYKLDNKFDLVFVVGYQKMLPLNYLNKLLDGQVCPGFKGIQLSVKF